MQALPQLKDVSSDQQSQGAAVNLTIDRDAAGRFGISPSRHRRGDLRPDRPGRGRPVLHPAEQLPRVVEAPPALQATPDLFNSIYILSPITGKTVPLSLFVKVDPNAHQQPDGQPPGRVIRRSTLSFNLAPGRGARPGDQAGRANCAHKLGAPATLTGSFQGTAQAFQQSLADEPILIAAALLAVYVILGVLYESFIHPLTILSTLPSAGLGALLALLLAGQDLNVIGIIAHHPADRHRQEERHHDRRRGAAARARARHRPEEAAVREASHQRLRPILMTTACAFLGGVPMILMHGTGSEFRQPLGFAIVGGLIVSQVLTLFTTPVIYIYLDRLRRRFLKHPVTTEALGMSPRLVPTPAQHGSGS